MRRARSRSTPARALAFVVLLAAAAHGGGARGDEPADRERSRVAFASGAKALDEGRAKEALAHFEEARRLYPHYSTSYNIGLCERALGHPVRAAAAFRSFLEGGGAAIESGQVSAVNALIAEAEAKIATVRLEVTPADADIALDGAPAERARQVRIDPGEHVVEASAEGHLPGKQTFEAPNGGSVVVRLRLVRTPPEAPRPRGPRLDAAFWVTAGLSGAALVTGAVTGAVALSDASAYADPATPDDEAERRRTRGETLRVVADVCFGAAIAGGLGATLLAVLRSPDPPPARGSVRVRPGLGWVDVGVRF